MGDEDMVGAGPAIEISDGGYIIRGEGGTIVQEIRYPTCQELAETQATGSGEAYAGQKFCLECGGPVPTGALYCREDAPYGLMHWLWYFSPIGAFRGLFLDLGRNAR